MKTTCVTCQGYFEFIVMTFCLTNAPTTFFHVMNQVFFNYIDDFVVVYLDDAVDFSESLKDHIVHFGENAIKAQEHRLYIKQENFMFAQETIKFLGHVILPGEV